MKDVAKATVHDNEQRLIELSHRIHANPETCFEEVSAAEWTASALSDAGFSIETGVADLPTAFVATAGTGPLTIGVCAEYDALPGIGHACGHNVIAAAAVGAGLALAPLADDLGITIKVFGTPAEEGGGGKIIMLDKGVFAGVHASMMVHPAPAEGARLPCLAVSHIDVHYHGKSAHASAFPELGINAADAITVAQTSIGLLRQHIRSTDRIHGIVTHGGDAPNIVPESTSGKWYIRSRTLAELAELEPKVHRCFEAGAIATGCTHEVKEMSPKYSEFVDDADLQQLYVANATALGRVFPTDGSSDKIVGSTDMANVSLAMPTIHPMLGLGCFPISNHQPEFAAFCATPTADKAVLDGAVAMAWTVIDAAADGSLRDRLLP
ncbi:MAG TPA: M20 family metallopeptidase [Acidimicrobiales bacterium]|nr:M20 family metallopeptidase [Acidimicrobiales bacterium]